MKSIKASRYSRLFWNKWNHDKKDISYNVGIAYDISGNLDRDKLLNTLKAVVESNIVLRSYFQENGKGELCQYFLTSPEQCIYFKDLGASKNAEASLKHIFNEAYNYKFDLTNPPLIRFYLVRLTDVHHILILRFHHILIDGTGIMQIPLQIEDFYNNDCLDTEENSDLFFNYLKYEEDKAEKYDMKKYSSYWNVLLGDNSLSISLSNKTVAKKIVSSDSISLHCFELDTYTADKVKEYCRKNFLSPSHFFMGVWAVLLSRYTGKDVIPLSFPVNMRPKKYNSVVTCLVNMLPLIVSIDEESDFIELVKNITKQVRTSFRYKDIPFTEMITEYYKSTKSSIDANMFNVGINGTESRTIPLKLKGLPDAPLIQSQALADYDINLEYQICENVIKFQFNYCTELFKENYIKKLSRHFTVLLKDILKYPNRKIGERQILGNAEYKKIVNKFNNTSDEYPVEKTVQQIFEEQAEKTPNNLAVIFDNKYLTYRELNEKANQLAHTIRKEYSKLTGEEVKSDTLIGIYIDRSIEMIISILAILKSGAAYVPFDLHDPEERLKFKINDSGARLILTALNNVYDLVFLMREDAFPMSIDTYWNKIEEAPVTNPEPISKPTDLAYVIYTSGSTGKPKGVMQLHRTVTNLIYYQKNKCNIDFLSNILQFTSVTFDVSVQEIFSTFFSGGTLYLVTEKIRKNILLLIDFIISQRINILFCPPAILNMIFNTKELTEKFYASSLKHIIAAGDKLVIGDNLKEILETEKICLHNHYGPTESHVTTAFTIKPDKACRWVYPPIGSAVSNHKLYVLDKKLRPLPVGIPGELYIGGDGLARGYFNRPELTNERFIKNPFASEKEKNSKLYKTGDIVKWLEMEDGNLEYLERNDFQVKIRGFRIEMGEIESKLLSYPLIKECTVTVYENRIINVKQLAAYYVIQKNETIPVESLKKYLGKILPYYMIPTYFIEMNEFPITVNGKVDRAKLPTPNLKINKSEKQDIKHSDYNNIRGELGEIWKRVLGVDNVGANDNFFELGGNSILSIQLMEEINKEYEINAPNYFIYNFQTIESQAKELGKNLFSPHSPFIFFNESEGKDILILIHPTGAGAEVYHKLLQELDVERFMVIGVNSYNINNQNNPTSDLKYIAGEYYKLLTDNVIGINTANIYVGGWSSGGNIAYELAGLFNNNGVCVKKLILFDSFNLSSIEDKANLDFKWQRRFVEKQLFNAGISGSLVNKMKKIISLETEGLDMLQHHPLNISTILFKCTQSRPYDELIDMSGKEKKESLQINKLIMDLEMNGWELLVDNLEVIKVPSHHGDIVIFPGSIQLIAESINKLVGVK
jgi:amino acid adenylation domain-containing protein